MANTGITKNLKTVLTGLTILIVVFVLMNFSYAYKNVKYLFVKPTPTTSNQVTAAKSDPDELEIPSLDVKAPVKYASGTTEKEVQALLIDGVVHYSGTAQAGQVGNDYIFGHSSDYIWSKGHYKTVFALLPKIQIGTEVYVSDSSGNQFKYKVVSTKVVATNDLSVLSQETSGKKILTLQTSYPVGTALKRFVAICEIAK